MESNLELSIIVPSYKRLAPLFKLIELIEPLQNHILFELLVIDQNQVEIRSQVELFVSDYKFVRLVTSEIPNVSTARNLGAKLSLSDYLLFLDDDIEPNVDFILEGLRSLRNHDEIEFLVPLILESNNQEGYVFNLTSNGYFDKWIDNRYQQIREAGSLALFSRKASFIAMGGFDELLFNYAGTAEDQEFFLRLSLNGRKLWLDRSLKVFHNHNASGGCELRTDEEWKVRVKCVKSWFLRRRLHGRNKGKLSWLNRYELARSVFLNKEGMFGQFGILKNIKLYSEISKDSYQYYSKHYKAL